MLILPSTDSPHCGSVSGAERHNGPAESQSQFVPLTRSGFDELRPLALLPCYRWASDYHHPSRRNLSPQSPRRGGVKGPP